MPPRKRTTAAVKPVTLRASVEQSIEAMPWLRDSDQAAVALALTYADQVDTAIATMSGQDVTKALYLGPHLLNTLRALGGAPAERKMLADGEPVGGRLAALRAVHGGKSA